jgi:uncharacterized protein YgiM (DUF1202 family)
MRVALFTSVICSFLLVLVMRTGPAAAGVHEVVFAVNKIQLHRRPGEAAPVVGHADEGDELEVLGNQGRWLRVRNGKQVGWVARTQVAESKPADPRNRTERSGFSGKHVDDAVKVTVVIDKVRGFDDPRRKDKHVLDLVRGEVVTVIGRGYDGWLLVQQDDDTVGWIPESTVTDAGKFASNPRSAPAELAKAKAANADVASAKTEDGKAEVTKAAAPTSPQRATPWLTGALLASGGAQSFKMAQSGQGDPSALATGPIAIIAARAQASVRGSIWVGVSTDVELGTADMTYYGDASAAPVPSASTHEMVIDGHAEVGWGSLPYIAARGGVHYETISVNSDRDEAMMIGGRVGGPTAGIAGALRIPLGQLWLSGAVDVMPAGAQRMARLPAGTLHATTVKGVWAHTTLAMPLPMHLMVALSYRFGLLSADLTDDGETPKTATRSDQSHVFAAGVGLAW